MKITRASASVLAAATLSILAACGGGGGGGGTPPVNGGNGATPTPTPTPTSTPVTGPQSIDGMACTQVTEGTSYPQDKFSQHVYVGIYFNGTWEAVPQALGMINPVEPKVSHNGNGTDAWEVETNQCEYNVHTHDYSGLVHIEDTSLPQSFANFPSYATLQSFLDDSGITLSASGLTIGSNTLSGPVTVYTGTPANSSGTGNDVVNAYAPFGSGAAIPTDSTKTVSAEINYTNGDPSWYTSGTASWAKTSGVPSTGWPSSNPNYASLKFARHMAIWIVIGTPPANGLPQVSFVINN